MLVTASVDMPPLLLWLFPKRQNVNGMLSISVVIVELTHGVSEIFSRQHIYTSLVRKPDAQLPHYSADIK
jgi:hypothetical protein